MSIEDSWRPPIFQIPPCSLPIPDQTWGIWAEYVGFERGTRTRIEWLTNIMCLLESTCFCTTAPQNERTVSIFVALQTFPWCGFWNLVVLAQHFVDLNDAGVTRIRVAGKLSCFGLFGCHFGRRAVASRAVPWLQLLCCFYSVESWTHVWTASFEASCHCSVPRQQRTHLLATIINALPAMLAYKQKVLHVQKHRRRHSDLRKAIREKSCRPEISQQNMNLTCSACGVWCVFFLSCGLISHSLKVDIKPVKPR